jgi:hypothetical protein
MKMFNVLQGMETIGLSLFSSKYNLRIPSIAFKYIFLRKLNRFVAEAVGLYLRKGKKLNIAGQF